MAAKKTKRTDRSSAELSAKSGPTRAHTRAREEPTKLSSSTPESPNPGVKPKRRRLDYGKALDAATTGATTAEIARVAGSGAAERNLSTVGAQILKRIRERGELQERFEAINFQIDDWCRGIKERMNATYTPLAYDKKRGWVAGPPQPDYKAQAKAADQYAEAVGIKQLPLEIAVAPETPFSHLSDEELAAILINERV
jgi:hypothetical protein